MNFIIGTRLYTSVGGGEEEVQKRIRKTSLTIPDIVNTSAFAGSKACSAIKVQTQRDSKLPFQICLCPSWRNNHTTQMLVVA